MSVATPPLISLEGVRKTYRLGSQEVDALAGVSLSVANGTFWAIMGPSGSGKSTMLNVLGCLDRISDGRYLFEGNDISRLSDSQLSELRLKRLGFIFQSFNLIPQLNVQENIELPLVYLGWDSAHRAQRALELARLVGLEDRLAHRPSELSGGQQQRVAIARSLANDPPVLLADEPTGNLDSTTGQQIMGLLGDLHRNGKTIIMVTHDSDVAEAASHCVYIRDGRIERIEEKD